MKEKNEKYVSILRRELKTAMGCTEPAAAALAGSLARETLGRTPEQIQVFASRDMIKNVMGVGIPNSTHTGLEAAVLLGVFYGEPDNGLNILSSISDSSQEELARFREQGKIRVLLAEEVPSVYIRVLISEGADSASVTISDEHDHVVEKVRNGIILFHAEPAAETAAEEAVFPDDWSINGIVDFVQHAPEEDLLFLLDVAETNRAIAEHALKNSFGLNVGRIMYEDLAGGINTRDDAFKYGAVLASAASDARMAGCSLPVIINSGSGNQGITATLPPYVFGTFLEADQQTLVRAMALSHLVAIFLAYHKGRLSALCGAFTAAIGTSCAYVYLLGGDGKQIENAINIMVANLMGILCDGAKKTCALKIYSCVDSAAMSAKLAINDCYVGSESGILGNDSLTTITNVQKVSHEGMEMTDKTILNIMVNKQGPQA